jgi:hypothetical protein
MSAENESGGEPPFRFEDIWPEDKPFPLSDAECARLVRGHLVRWRGTLEEMLDLPGMYEMMDGWLYVRRT